jgi:hypothetical protein
MVDAPDWTDTTPRPLAEAARLAFPDGGVDADTLKRRIRQGKLAAYRPGKRYLTSLRDVWAMIEATRVVAPLPRPRITPAAPNPLGLTASDLASMALDAALAGIPSKPRRR